MPPLPEFAGVKAGNRDKRIVFERFTFTQNEYGEEVESETPITFKRWAQVWMGKGSVWDIEGIAPDTPERGYLEITAVRGSIEG